MGKWEEQREKMRNDRPDMFRHQPSQAEMKRAYRRWDRKRWRSEMSTGLIYTCNLALAMGVVVAQPDLHLDKCIAYCAIPLLVGFACFAASRWPR